MVKRHCYTMGMTGMQLMYSTNTDSGVADSVHMCAIAARRVVTCKDMGLQSGGTGAAGDLAAEEHGQAPLLQIGHDEHAADV